MDSTIAKIHLKYNKYLHKYPDALKSKELNQFGIIFTHNSTKIEGSTLSSRDTQLLLQEGITPANKPINDVIETIQHMKIYQQMLHIQEESLSLKLIKEWHKILFFRTKSGMAGIFRGIEHPFNVKIGGSKYSPPHWENVQNELMKLNLWYVKARKELHPVYIAAKYHCWFIAIHPFTDGNGRIGRILMNFIIYKNNYPMFDITPDRRKQYFNALERTMIKKLSSFHRLVLPELYKIHY